jgi:hypothetical protein
MSATKLVILAPLLTGPAQQPPKEPHSCKRIMSQTPRRSGASRAEKLIKVGMKTYKEHHR